jgi:metal-sulfur cluster biosynthetic enzyme
LSEGIPNFPAPDAFVVPATGTASSLPAATDGVPNEAQIRAALRVIQDPEIHLSILDLGLIYGVQSNSNGTVRVQMTLTSPACPVGPLLQAQVQSAVLRLPGVQEAMVELVWNPPWDPRTMASDDIKMELGLL